MACRPSEGFRQPSTLGGLLSTVIHSIMYCVCVRVDISFVMFCDGDYVPSLRSCSGEILGCGDGAGMPQVRGLFHRVFSSNVSISRYLENRAVPRSFGPMGSQGGSFSQWVVREHEVGKHGLRKQRRWEFAGVSCRCGRRRTGNRR